MRERGVTNNVTQSYALPDWVVYKLDIMNFFKRILAWSSRRKGRSKKKGRYGHGNGDGDGGRSILAHQESNSRTSDAPSWPSPSMLIELGARRTAVSYESLHIAPSAQTRNDVTGSQESNARPTSGITRSRRSEEAFNITATASPNNSRPVSTIASALNQQLVDEGLAGAHLS